MDKYDGILGNIAASEGSVDKLFEVFFGFLRRKTDFFDVDPKNVRNLVENQIDKHFEIKQKELKEKEKKYPRVEEVIEKVDTKKNLIKKDEEQDVGNGGKTDKYIWTQSLNQVEVTIELNNQIKAKNLKINITSTNLSIFIKNDEYINGQLHLPVKPSDCVWSISDGVLQITLEKVDQVRWWSCLLIGEKEIDTTKIVPENSKLSDLDLETRATVEKMMFDQNRKKQGLPTSDEQKNHDLLQKFMKQHPEMDFSKVKIQN